MHINTTIIGIIHSGDNNQNHDTSNIAKKFRKSKHKYNTHISNKITFISALLYFNFFNIFILNTFIEYKYQYWDNYNHYK